MSNTRVAQQVFVIGCPRSGTSALSWALAEHPKMWTSAESDFMHQMFKGNMLFDVYKNSMDRPDTCLLYTSPSPRDRTRSRMPSSA